MESSAKELFDNMVMLYENIYNLTKGFQLASVSQGSNINVTLNKYTNGKFDGSTESVNITSFQKLQQELSRIDNNYKSLISADNLSFTVEADGTISSQIKTTFLNAEYLDNFNFGTECIVDKTSIVDDLIFPSVKIPIKINSKLISDVHIKTLEFTMGWENITDSMSVLDIDYLYNLGKINYKEVNRTVSLEKYQVQYFGKFTIESVKSISTTGNDYQIVLNDIKYLGLNSVGSSINLKVNDILVSKTGSAKYIITDLDKFTKTLNVTRIAGSETLSVGVEALMFNEKVPVDENIVGIPVKPNQKLLVFISTENLKNISFPSVGIKIDTSSYTVSYQNTTYTLDEFFSSFVTNFSEYLMSFINETSIPINLGVIPEVPKLDTRNFKVVQINKHLTNNKTIKEIDDLNKRKQALSNDIEYKTKEIDKFQQEVDTVQFKSAEEKQLKLTAISVARSQINAIKQNLLTVTREIDSNAIQNGLKVNQAKYKVIGFWGMQDAIYSPLTKPQHIIKYEVQYRYLSKDVDTIENTSYTMIANGKEISVVFSAWNDLQTKSLNKSIDMNGKLTWETQVLDSAEDININQLSISLNENESLEIRVRAVSEAGYPIAPLKSSWSEILRIDFPTDLTRSGLQSTISQNNIDLAKAEFEGILSNYGLLSHISGTIKEAEKTYLHNAKDIASGQFTPEQKNIALDVAVSTLFQEIALLKNSNVLNNVTINVVDFNNESFIINKNTTLELFAGNYSDTVNLLDKTKWGSIIKQKGYIKVKNANSVPIELKTLVPGIDFNQTTAPNYWNVPVRNVTDDLRQLTKQILYFRNIDITGQIGDTFSLIKDNTNSPTWPQTNNIDGSVSDNDKNVIYIDSNGIVNRCKLTAAYNRKFNAFTSEHPDYNISFDQTIRDKFIPEFDRLKTYSDILKMPQKQANTQYLGFADNDFYSIGENTCGAFLYPVISNQNTISVVGNTTTATLIIPANSEILIPFVYEFRMIDRFGNINGLELYDPNTVLEYSKKIGIDMMINNEPFKFDINVSSKLKSKITSIDSLNINSIVSVYNNEPQTPLT